MSSKNASSSKGFDRSSFDHQNQQQQQPYSASYSGKSMHNIVMRDGFVVDPQIASSLSSKQNAATKTATSSQPSIISFIKSMVSPKKSKRMESSENNWYSWYESDDDMGSDITSIGSTKGGEVVEAEYVHPKHNKFMGKLIANTSTGNKINKPLSSLTMHEVRYLLECLEMHDYVTQFMNKEMCGGLLNEINSIDDLRDLGIDLPEQVERIFFNDLQILKTRCLVTLFTV